MRVEQAISVVSLTVAAVIAACSSQPPAPAKTVTVTVATPASPGSPVPSPEPPAPPVPMGQEARDGNFVFTVTEARPLAGDMAGKGVAVFLSVKNVGNSAETYFATDQKLIDAQGRQFSVDTNAMLSAPMNPSSRQLAVLSTDINPGTQLDVATIFAMPAGAKPAQMVLHESAQSTGVTVNLASG